MTPGSRRKLSPKQISTAIKEHADGMSWADPGRRFAIDPSTLRKQVQAAGVKP
jgi:hypothetical protein